MKFLATSDWHIGNVFHGVDRLPEHRHFLKWLKAQIVEQRPDVLLVAGDVFDNGNPSAAAQALYYEFLAEVTTACPWLQLVITAGNHDSAHRLEAPRALLHRHQVEVRGSVHRRWEPDGEGGGQWLTDFDDLIVPVTSADGNEHAVVLAVPFLRSDVMVDGSYSKGVNKLLGQLTATARERYADVPLVMMTHMYATGADIAKDSSERIVIGGMEQVDMADWDVRPDYLSCGHIHKRQSVWGTQWARYTGSVLPMSFAERDYHHGVDVVNVMAGQSPKVDFLEYTPQHKLLSLPEAELKPLLKTIAETMPDRGDVQSPDEAVYVELKLLSAQLKPEERKRIEDAVATKNAVLCRLQLVTPDLDLSSLSADKPLSTIDDVLHRDPMEALRESFLVKHRLPMSERQEALLARIINKVKNDDDHEDTEA